MYDDDVILPVDEETEANEAAAKEFIEQQQETDEANNNLYQRAYGVLLDNGYSADEAEQYYNHPNVVNQVRQTLDAEAYEEFLKEYPGVKPEEIPVKAWEAFQRNGNLVKSFENNDPFLKAFTADMPKSKAKSRRREDPFEKGFDSI